MRIEENQRIDNENQAIANEAIEAKKSKAQHRKKIHIQAKDALVKNGFDCETATKIVTLIKDGMIDNINIEY